MALRETDWPGSRALNTLAGVQRLKPPFNSQHSTPIPIKSPSTDHIGAFGTHNSPLRRRPMIAAGSPVEMPQQVRQLPGQGEGERY